LFRSATPSCTRRGRIGGFSMVELVVSMAVLMVLTAIAIPSLMHSLRTYQLNDAAGRLSDMLKFTRFEAVRRNTQVNFLIRASGSNWIAGTDSNNNGAIDPTEKQILIGSFATLLPSGTPPSSGSILGTLGGVNSLTTVSGAATITFDARGAVTPLVAYVLYLGNPNGPDFGYRAVILLPSGATQIWTAPSGGPWKRTG
jgi:type II secretory pathway pseudopilin PulG